MALQEHELYRTSFSYVEPWLSLDKRTLLAMRKHLEDKSLSPKQRYELGSFLYCETSVGIFSRLEKIKQMAGHSLYRRKGEDITTLKKEWLVYNYHNYMMIYQSVLDVALQLTNEILDLGIPEKECKFHIISKNRRVMAAGIESILVKLSQLTKKHREGKNLLLHYGKGTSPPVRMGQVTSINVSDIARKLGWEEDKTAAALEEFLAIKDQEALVDKMNDECNYLELQVERLFGKLLPQYIRIHSFYSEGM